ncbi:hypothetical protein LJC42_05600 [Eubacteriales bacterium OttesenSCG-928-K08]|nr:hypothetical protein [Eubacteriales bacterium OttesenSCG-928-K08]
MLSFLRPKPEGNAHLDTYFHDIFEQECAADERYAAVQKKYEDAQITVEIGSGIENYIDKIHLRGALQCEAVYSQGYLDCVCLLRELGVIQ